MFRSACCVICGCLLGYSFGKIESRIWLLIKVEFYKKYVLNNDKTVVEFFKIARMCLSPLCMSL